MEVFVWGKGFVISFYIIVEGIVVFIIFLIVVVIFWIDIVVIFLLNVGIVFFGFVFLMIVFIRKKKFVWDYI